MCPARWAFAPLETRVCVCIVTACFWRNKYSSGLIIKVRDVHSPWYTHCAEFGGQGQKVVAYTGRTNIVGTRANSSVGNSTGLSKLSTLKFHPNLAITFKTNELVNYEITNSTTSRSQQYYNNQRDSVQVNYIWQESGNVISKRKRKHECATNNTVIVLLLLLLLLLRRRRRRRRRLYTFGFIYRPIFHRSLQATPNSQM